MEKKIFVVGDIHFPWHHGKVLEKVFLAMEIEKPDIVVQVGDVYDMFSMTRFARSHDIVTPKQEVTEARLLAEGFWKRVRNREKPPHCYQLRGNHDERPLMRLFEKFPEIASIVDISHLWEFPGVTTVKDARQELILEGLCFIHGYRSRLGDHAKYNQMPTVCGHSHCGGVVFFPMRGGEVIYELNAGYVADPEAVPLSYGKQKIVNWTHGFGIIDRWGPRFCPLDAK